MELHVLLMGLVSSAGLFLVVLGVWALMRHASPWLALACVAMGVGANLLAFSRLRFLALSQGIGFVVAGIGAVILLVHLYARHRQQSVIEH